MQALKCEHHKEAVEKQNVPKSGGTKEEEGEESHEEEVSATPTGLLE